MSPRVLVIGFRVAFFAALGALSWLATTSSDVITAVTLWDKANHAIAFFVLAFLLDYSMPNRRSAFDGANLWKWLILLGYGLGIEGVQWLLGTRTLEVQDAVADLVGIAAWLALRRPSRQIPLLDDLTTLR